MDSCLVLEHFQRPECSLYFKALSNGHALSLFNVILIEGRKPGSLRADLKLTSQHYYSRTSALTKSNLVKKGVMLTLTSFDKLVYDSQITIQKGLEDLSKLKVTDSLEKCGGL